MSLLLFPFQLVACYLLITLVRLYLLPTAVLAPLLRSRFQIVAVEAAYCVAEHGSTSKRVGAALLLRLLNCSRDLEHEILRALERMSPSLAPAVMELQQVLAVLAQRGSRQEVVWKLVKLIDSFDASGIGLVPLMLRAASSQTSAVGERLKSAAYRLIGKYDVAALPLELLEQLVLDISRSCLEGQNWEVHWFAALKNMAAHLGSRRSRGGEDAERALRVENELGLMVLQNPKATLIREVDEALVALRRAA